LEGIAKNIYNSWSKSLKPYWVSNCGPATLSKAINDHIARLMCDFNKKQRLFFYKNKMGLTVI
jgi:hypothetical protein